MVWFYLPRLCLISNFLFLVGDRKQLKLDPSDRNIKSQAFGKEAALKSLKNSQVHLGNDFCFYFCWKTP